MKKSFIVLVITIFYMIMTIGIVFAEHNTTEDILGIWLGTLKVSGVPEQTVYLRVAQNSDGSLASRLGSPDRGAADIWASKTEFNNGKLFCEIKDVATFTGSLNNKGKLVGEFIIPSISATAITVTMDRTDTIPKITRQQDPKPPFPYKEEDVTYENKAGGVTLSGTLATPQGEGPFPAVILITGSGPQDRNETVAGHHPFWILSDYLARKGIAVLRVDDRGVGGSTGNVDFSTSADFCGDVLAGVEFLKNRKEINPRQIGLIGHSEGGLIAPMAATKSADIAYIILMAGPGRPGDEIVLLQTALIGKVSGQKDSDIVRIQSIMKKAFAVLKQETDATVIQSKFHEIAVNAYNDLSDSEKKTIRSPKIIEDSLKSLSTPWFHFFINYDPQPALKSVTCPVLALNGEKDLQVPPKENLRAIQTALTEGGNKDFTAKEMPNLNHLFQNSRTGSPAEYATIQETIAPSVLQTIGDWIIKHTAPQ